MGKERFTLTFLFKVKSGQPGWHGTPPNISFKHIQELYGLFCHVQDQVWDDLFIDS